MRWTRGLWGAVAIALFCFTVLAVLSPPGDTVVTVTEGGSWEPARILDTALEWKNMFEDPDYVEAHHNEFRLGQRRFLRRYPGSFSRDYRGYISGAFPVYEGDQFLPLTGMGCSRYVWAVFKTVYPDRTWEFMDTAAMYDIIRPTLDARARDSVSARELYHERIRLKAKLLGRNRPWIERARRNFALFEVIESSTRARAGDLVVWALGPPLEEAGHVGIVVDADRREYVGANGRSSGITIARYTRLRGPDGPYFLRWRGIAPEHSGPNRSTGGLSVAPDSP